MKKIMTRFFGELEIDETKIATFPEGILGFEDCREYVLMPHPKDPMFCWLQSVDRSEVCFLIADPALFMFNYSIDIQDDVVEKLAITRAETVAAYALVVVPDDPLKVSANLAGPLIINTDTCLGAQVISMNPEHKVKHYIIDELKANASTLITNFVDAFAGNFKVNVAAEAESAFCQNLAAELVAEPAAMAKACGL